MGLLDLSLRQGVNQSGVSNPFARPSPSSVKGGVERQDFPNGFVITEIEDGIPLEDRRIILKGSLMPHVPFTFGGEQKIVKEYYAGNAEPSVHVMGSQESNISINGRFKARKIPISLNDPSLEEVRTYPRNVQQQVTAMRLRGNLLRIQMGEFERYGFIEKSTFEMKSLEDMMYTIDFSILGFNPPTFCKVSSETSRDIPFEVTGELTDKVAALQALPRPASFDRTLAEQISDGVSELAENVVLVTNYIDTTLGDLDAVRQSVIRAVGLIKNARVNASRYINRLGALSVTGGVLFTTSPTAGIASGYINTGYILDNITGVSEVVGVLARLQTLIEQISLTVPIARHRIIEGDTLQKIAVKFYNNADHWA